MGILKGIKVLSFTHFLQGPSAVQILSDLGAEVIKIEQTNGAYERYWSGFNTFKEGVSIFYLLANRKQKSLAIDLRIKEGKKIILKLVEEADVLVQNFRPGAMKRLGLDYETLKKINPNLIYCSCTGYGLGGPYETKPGQDLLLQSVSGLMQLNGRKGDPPTPTGTAIVDQHGAVLSALGVITALYNRERTGEGCEVEGSLLNAALDLQIEPLTYYLNKGELWDRSSTGLGSRFHQAPYGVYKTNDGYITISNTPVEKLAEILDSEELARFSADDQMSDKRFEIDRIFSGIIKDKSLSHWKGLFDKHQIWYAPVNTYDEVIKDSQVQWSEMIKTYHHPQAGSIKLLSHPIRYNGKPLEHKVSAPAVGENSREILLKQGYTEEQIEELIDNGVISENSWKPTHQVK